MRFHSLVPKPRSKPKPLAAPRTTSEFWICLALLLITAAVYARVGWFDFVNFDDPEYIIRNAHVRNGLSADGIAWAFKSGYAANWFPLTWISHMADCQLFGLVAGWHHWTSVLLHAVAACVLFAFLRRATRAPRPSAFVAFLFALHPLHVESVAWVAERKDVLAAVFWFLALWAYVRYVERATRGRYALLGAFFACGLMAKPMVVTLPFLLLVLDFWPLRRLPPIGPRVREKLPLFALSVLASAITYSVQRASGAVKPLAAFPAGLRVENALVSYVWYLAKTLWPSGMAVFYPFPLQLPAWQALGAGVVLLAITFLVWRTGRKRPHLIAGWLWFLGTLVPVIGLVQVGTQARADRYMYVPMVGLSIMLAWSLPPTRTAAALAVSACACFAALTWVQLGYWRSSETLFTRALEVTPDNSIAEHNLGSALLDEPGRLPDAIAHLQAALRLGPGSAQAHSDLGSALARTGQTEQAIHEFRTALSLDPGSAIVHNNLASALATGGQAEQAISEYQSALRIDPEYAEAKQNLEIAQRDLAAFHYNAGVTLAREGRASEAIAEFEECLRTRPSNAEA
ncbi:MAG TPA: tetratricopeptide repeat protein, partial [Candidatus Sulfopaludibacter sp.]|nr:tetratricopeptide repeat protein [Candidatus Sulfopaludibacter sp.]